MGIWEERAAKSNRITRERIIRERKPMSDRITAERKARSDRITAEREARQRNTPKTQKRGSQKSVFVAAENTRTGVSEKGVKKLRERYDKPRDVSKEKDYKKYSKEWKKVARGQEREEARKRGQERKEKVVKAAKYVKDKTVVGKSVKNLGSKGAQAEKKLYTLARKEIKARRVMKKGKVSYKMPKYVEDNYWNRRPIYFKEAFEEDKRSLFFE